MHLVLIVDFIGLSKVIEFVLFAVRSIALVQLVDLWTTLDC